MYIFMNVLSVLMILVLVLVGVAYLTLLERKVLSYIQYRKGPNKVGVMGVFQPVSDAMKLLSKEILLVFKSNYFIYYFSPSMMLIMMMLLWLMVPWVTNIYYMNYSMLFMFLLMSLSSYMLLMMGWSSNSSYSMLGVIRLIAQIISYEVSFILIVFCVVILSESFSIMDLIVWQAYMWNLVILFPVFLMFFISVLAETNRTPSDLIEGESELVSGFNIEYFGGGFALIFLGEYGMIMFFCFITLLLFTNLFLMGLMFTFSFIVLVGLIIYMRGVLPRIRYDSLMFMCWKVILPLILSYLSMIFGFKFILMFFF
ncbi:nad1 (mitochondrion) [Ooceraea biroi]|uniref:NADH-ubiquinone oxidoreductase chain 1 n=1 Tax=Ooceraea biroi TaxID=2015173 RepID=A0A3L8D372_OOCBI|nr:nad1 [Ooceraea biroi]